MGGLHRQVPIWRSLRGCSNRGRVRDGQKGRYALPLALRPSCTAHNSGCLAVRHVRNLLPLFHRPRIIVLGLRVSLAERVFDLCPSVLDADIAEFEQLVNVVPGQVCDFADAG